MLVRLCSKAFKIGFSSTWMELPDAQAGFWSGRGTKDQIAKGERITEKGKSRSTPTSASLTILKPSMVWITTNCGKFFEMGVPDHLTSLLKNLYAESTVRTRHGTNEWSKIGKGVRQGYIHYHPAYLIICRIFHTKCLAGWITSWNQDCREKYQQPKLCKWN